VREIKFRAWLLSEQKMYYQNPKMNDVCKFGFKGNRIAMMKIAGVVKGINDYETGLEEFVLMQYTGLKANSKEIYGGDILFCKLTHNEKFEVSFIDACFELYDIRGVYCLDLKQIYSISEVIGNIYENPELLK